MFIWAGDQPFAQAERQEGLGCGLGVAWCSSIIHVLPTDRTPSISTFDSIEMGRGWDEDSNKDPDDRVPGKLHYP